MHSSVSHIQKIMGTGSLQPEIFHEFSLLLELTAEIWFLSFASTMKCQFNKLRNNEIFSVMKLFAPPPTV
jgi:hypothetical protein